MLCIGGGDHDVLQTVKALYTNKSAIHDGIFT